MIPAHVKSAVFEALGMLPAKMTSHAALVMLYAIGLQESRFSDRYQVLNDPTKKGPARGYWQFERGGGVRGVLEHNASEKLARMICEQRSVEPTPNAVWLALENDDVLAAAFARLLLWTDARALPPPADKHETWDCYVRNWRPGKPWRQKWDGNLSAALLAADRRQELRQ